MKRLVALVLLVTTLGATRLNGMAPLYAPFPGPTSRFVSADLTLPESQSNKDWYCNWVMIVGTAQGTTHAVFVQVGLMRRPGHYKGTKIFVAWQNPTDPNIGYREYDDVGDGHHVAEIRETDRGYTFAVDGTTVGSPIAMPFVTEYAQVGPEVYAEGDSLVGTVQHATVGSGSQMKAISGDDTCRYVNHDVRLTPGIDDEFSASGVFDRTKPSKFLGDCSWYPPT